VAGGEYYSSAGRIMLLTIAFFLLCTQMVRCSISIQPPSSPYGFTVAHCHRAVLLKFESTIMTNKKSRRCLLSPAGSNAFFGVCACADAQVLISGGLPQKVLLYCLLCLALGNLGFRFLCCHLLFCFGFFDGRRFNNKFSQVLTGFRHGGGTEGDRGCLCSC
jgi:hypothetical protein